MTASPPTDRVLDVLELLAVAAPRPPRVAEVARELDISVSTAHSIVATLCERGWVSRDPVDKTLSLGPALEATVLRVDVARPLAHAARALALQLSEELGYAVSISERAGDHLVPTFYGTARDAEAPLPPLDRFPFAAPFGPAFAAWSSDAEQAAWIGGGEQHGPELSERYREVLAATRERGYSVERMSPSLAQAAQLLSGDDDHWSGPVRDVIRHAMLDAATFEQRSGARPTPPVSALSAPVFGRHGLVALNIGVHPFEQLPARRIAQIGRRLRAAAAAVTS